MKLKNKYYKISVLCFCGIKVSGNSPENVEKNLIIHQDSLIHKKQISGTLLIIKPKIKNYLWEIETDIADIDKLAEINKEMIKKFGGNNQIKKEGVEKEIKIK